MMPAGLPICFSTGSSLPALFPTNRCGTYFRESAFETPLAGGAAASMCASAFCWPIARQRRGGNPHVEYVFALLPTFPLDSDHQPICPLCRSARFAFQKSCWRHPLLCRASIRTLSGPRWARCKLGSDLKPRSITTVTDLGCWVLPSTA
jgi:hypothetical protein